MCNLVQPQASFLLVVLLHLIVSQANSAPSNCTICHFCDLDYYGDDFFGDDYYGDDYYGDDYYDYAYDYEQTSLCKCDRICKFYGDCCHASFELNDCEVGNELDLNLLSGLEFTCRSIYPNSDIIPNEGEAYWMVSNCPSSRSPDEASQACMSGNCASLSSSLPPVTDLNTGIVYFNEYYAICNGVENVRVWQPSLACTNYVYNQIAAIGVQTMFAQDPTIFQTQCQTCTYQMPTLNLTLSPRPCTVSVSSCLDLFQLRNMTEEEISDKMYFYIVEECKNGPYDIVASLGVQYRNRYCAACNGVSEEFYDCYYPLNSTKIPDKCAPSDTTEAPTLEVSGSGSESGLGINNRVQNPPPFIGNSEPRNTPTGIPFTIALSNLGGGQVQVSVESEVVTVMVDCPDGQAALGLECRPTLCPQGYVESGGRCAFLSQNNTNKFNECSSGLVALNSSDYIRVNNETIIYNNHVLTILEIDIHERPIVCLNSSSEDFFHCPTSLIPLNTSEFTNLGNDAILFEDEKFAVVEYDDFGRPLICPPNSTTILVNTTIYSYPEGYFILTYIGCSLSVVGSALVLLTYGLFKSLRTLPSLILMNLSAAILANNLLIIIGGPVSQAFPSVELCTIVAILLHFFFLCQFSWMTVMSFQMARTFYKAAKLKIDSGKKLFLLYFMIGWSIPIAITAISVIVNFTTENLVQYGELEDGRQGSCWINHFESAIVSFIVPLVISFLINATLFIVVATYICMAARSSSKVDKGQNIQYFRVNVATFSVSGLTWVFGFVALLAGTSWAWYPFIILNSTQGFVIFVAFILTKRVLRLYYNLLTCCKSIHTSSSGTQKKTLSQLPSKTLTSNSIIVNVYT